MPPVEATRHCWLRPDRAKLSALEELVAGTRQDKKLAESLRGLIELRDARGFEAARRAAFEVTPADRGPLKGVKELAIVAMYASDRARARPELLRILEDETASPWKHDAGNPAVRGGHWASGAAIIGYMAADSGWREFVPGLLRALASPYAGMGQRAGLLRCLGRLGDVRAREAVREQLYDRDPDVLPEAARAAGRLGDRAAIARLRELTECGYAPTELAAAMALGELGDGAIALRMRGWLGRVGDEDYRGVAARVLGRLGDRGSLSALREAAKHESFPWVRAEMERAARRVR
jgi:HEAT repeat protein